MGMSLKKEAFRGVSLVERNRFVNLQKKTYRWMIN